eukprot:Hpha_TRINITY_DN13156_c0_g2::TRINITY_DN13156_c0_g2_i1::g.113437::m.113437
MAKPLEISATAWAVVTLRTHPHELMVSLVGAFDGALCARNCDLGPQVISNVVWAASRVRLREVGLLNRLAGEEVTRRGLSCFANQHLGNVAHAIGAGAGGRGSIGLVVAVAEEAAARSFALSPADLCGISEAAARVHRPSGEPLSAHFARIGLQGFPPSDAGALGLSLGESTLATGAEECCREGVMEVATAAELAGVVWAHAVGRTAAQEGGGVYGAAARVVSRWGLGDQPTEGIGAVCWGLAVSRYRTPAAVAAGVEELCRRGGGDEAEVVVAVSWAAAASRASEAASAGLELWTHWTEIGREFGPVDVAAMCWVAYIAASPYA